jgi:L-asparaginase
MNNRSRHSHTPRGAEGSATAAGREHTAHGTRRWPRIHLLIGHGTLHSVGKDRMDLLNYRRSGIPRMTGEELLAPLPEIASIATVEVDKGNPWENVGHDDLRKIALRMNAVLHSPEIDGAVYIQGTNTLEEAAYFLSLTVHSDKPIVVVGAQRPYNALSSDGPINLLNAIRVACCPQSRGKGAVVVLNGEINAARDVTKTNTYHLQAFRSPDLGMIGYADADKIEYYRTPLRRHTVTSELSVEGVESIPCVDIIYIHTGTRAGLAEAMIQRGAKGLVVATTGGGMAGHLDQELWDIVRQRRAVVVQSSRVGSGRVVRHNNWWEPGMVVADTLNPQKAAILLALTLIRTSDPEEIQRFFDEY